MTPQDYAEKFLDRLVRRKSSPAGRMPHGTGLGPGLHKIAGPIGRPNSAYWMSGPEEEVRAFTTQGTHARIAMRKLARKLPTNMLKRAFSPREIFTPGKTYDDEDQ